MQVVHDPGWSVGLNSRPSDRRTDVMMLSRLGGGLRGLYQDLLDEPLPEYLTAFVREFEQRKQTNEARPD